MKKHLVSLLILLLLISTSFTGVSNQIKQKRIPVTIDHPLDGGSIVYTPMATKTTYMVNEEGEVTQVWESEYTPGYSVYRLSDNSILRAFYSTSGRGVQRIASDGTVLWEYTYVSDSGYSHHDIEPLPNGNVLILANEEKTFEESIEQGRKPSLGSAWPDYLIEVHPTGPTSGDIVWEWHVWDHLVQDYDPSKPNYGVVSDHPELIDINYPPISGKEWLHTNCVDYNEKFDQVLLTVRNFNEIWVINRSSGEIVYRWGNPTAYGRGTDLGRVFFFQHGAVWVPEGYPGAGNILVFNNGVGRGYSSVDELVPPVDQQGNYEISPGEPYGPDSLVWTHNLTWFTLHLSGAERLPSGNTLILEGENGFFSVVTPDHEQIWSYTDPPPIRAVFKPFYVSENLPNEPDLSVEGGLQWTDVVPGSTVVGSFVVKNVGTGSVDWEVNASLIEWGDWTITPESGTVYPGCPETVSVKVIAPDEESSNFEGYLKVQNKDNPNDFELIPVILTTSFSKKTQISFGAESNWTIKEIIMPFSYEPQYPFIHWLLERFPNAFLLLRQLMGY
jgi:hypothetical protein